MIEEQGKVFYLFPRRKNLHSFLNAASACAHQMLDAAVFIQDELQNLKLSDERRASITRLCNAFAGSKHDICNDLASLPHAYSWDFVSCRASIARIVDAIIDDLKLMRTCTDALEADGASLAYILLAETGTGLLDAFDQVQTAAAALRAEIH